MGQRCLHPKLDWYGFLNLMVNVTLLSVWKILSHHPFNYGTCIIPPVPHSGAPTHA